ncbi:sensor histidine kinase [Pseudidiomarina sp. PP-1MA]|uniref:histidine kinase n=1 Tax=Pseudidiomarina sp. PP-1MA TaxID=3237706 RepID=A0AB39X8I9_9GAMM
MTKRYTWLARWWRKSGDNLQRVLTFYVMLPLLALSGIAIGVGLERAAEFQNERLRDDLELVGRAIRIPISNAMVRQDLDTVQASLDAVFQIGRVYGASVYNTDGALIASAGITERDLTQSLVAEQVILTGEAQDSYREVAGRDVFSQFVPIQDNGGQIIGFMQLNRRAQDFDNAFADLAQVAWGTWLVLAIATIGILVFGHYRGVGRYLEQKLEQQRRDQEKMVAIGQVASGVAHELGAPLTVIDARAKKLARLHTEPESQRQLKAIRGQVQRLTKIVQQLLDFTRTPITAKRQVVLADVINQAYQAVSYEQPEPPIRFSLPAAAESIRATIDVQRFELALVNIFRNAMQAATSQVSVVIEKGNQQVLVRVRDDGAGLPQQLQHDDLLQPFTTTKQVGKGTGLGLALVSYIMADHQGQVRLRNHPTGGCEVVLTLPTGATDV